MRNNIIRKLTRSGRGTQPYILRVTTMVLCDSVAEYTVPVWKNSHHMKQADILLNDIHLTQFYNLLAILLHNSNHDRSNRLKSISLQVDQLNYSLISYRYQAKKTDYLHFDYIDFTLLFLMCFVMT